MFELHSYAQILCLFIYKEGPGDGITLAKVYVLCFIILERLVDITIDRVYVLCFTLLYHVKYLKEGFRFMFFISKEGPDDGVKVYVLCFMILERLVVDIKIDSIYVLCFTLLYHMIFLKEGFMFIPMIVFQ